MSIDLANHKYLKDLRQINEGITVLIFYLGSCPCMNRLSLDLKLSSFDGVLMLNDLASQSNSLNDLGQRKMIKHISATALCATA